MNTILDKAVKLLPPEEWLIISHAFNMDGRAASLTITDKIPCLQKHGITPIVVSGVLGSKDTHLEHYKVLPAGPSGLRFDLRHLVRRKTSSKAVYNLIVGLLSLALSPFSLVERIFTGLSGQASWAVSAYFRGKSLISSRRIPVVYTTGGAYSAHLAGYWLKRHFGQNIKWLAEIHDPIIMPGQTLKTREEKFLADLEAQIAKRADLVWWFTEGARNSACKRHPEFINKSFWVLPGSSQVSGNHYHPLQSKLSFGHFGSLTENRSLSSFLFGLNKWLLQNPKYRRQVEVHFYGGKPDQYTQKTIQQLGVGNIVQTHGRTERSSDTGKSGREQIQEKMRKMTCLLIPHGKGLDCAEYIPSKFYDYLWAGRPIFVLSTGNPQFEELIKDRKGWFVDFHNTDQVARAIAELVNLWESDNLDSTWKYEPISSESCVATILEQFTKIRGKKNA